ncbi:VCBS domain-containing protein, partial [Aquimarina sp. D1M17]|uniref:beta strand repeat-containing protein n=1 Tax=Aquimarina acroporae TaxID=2937283 RepID=UPI0020BF2DDB
MLYLEIENSHTSNSEVTALKKTNNDKSFIRYSLLVFLFLTTLFYSEVSLAQTTKNQIKGIDDPKSLYLFEREDAGGESIFFPEDLFIDNSFSVQFRSARANRAAPVIDLDGNTTGNDFSFFVQPTSGLVYRVSQNESVTSDDGNIVSATISISGVLDPQELFAIPPFSGTDLFFFNGADKAVNYTFGSTVLTFTQTGGTNFTVTEANGLPIPNSVFESFMATLFYGDLNDSYTEGVRTMTVTVTDSNAGMGSANTFIRVWRHEPVAVDDTGTILANAVTPITGNILTNDTDSTPGEVLSVSEVNVFPSAVGSTYTTLYGSITIQSDGSYSYTVNTSSPAVAGLTSTTSLDDIIAYTVEDLTGRIDYGILTITINGVDDPPVAVDDNNSVSVGVVNTATGNVIDGDGVSGQDLLDRPLSRLIWENEFVNGATVTGQTRVIDGVSLDFTSLDPSGAGNAFNQTSQNNLTNGGHTGYLLFNIDPATNPVSDTQLIIDFDQEVFNVGFLVTDIDYSQGTAWQDQITIQGFAGGSPTPVNYNFIITGGIVDAGSDTYYGTGTAIEADATGNINVAFQAPIDQLVISYNYGPDATDADPGGQIAGVSDIFWQGENVVAVSEVNGVAANVGNSIPTMYGFLTINSDGTYTYVLDQNNPAVIALAAGATLIDSTPYTLRDGALNTDSANLIITIIGTLDTDNDDVPDEVDLDDDNDGIIDTLENDLGVDPSADADDDGILNYQDADNNGSGSAPTCTDGNTDGICDDLDSTFDRDQDGVPNHLDLDSDNDGIYDAVEAGHNQTQVNGVVSGAVGTDGIPDVVQGVGNENSGTINYTVTDSDTDNDDNFLELDSDNDGCDDVIEAGFTDNDNNGLLGNGTFGSGLTVDGNGVVTSGSDGYTGTNSNVITPGTAPSITTQPTNSTICPDTSTTFSVTTSNANTYQWQLFNGSSWDDLTNSGIHSTVTSATLTITNAPVGADGNRYRVIVSSSTYLCNAITSNDVELTVEDTTNPTASNPSPITAQCAAPAPDITVVTDEADNCGTPTVAFVSDVSDGNSNPEVITRTYSVTDAAGNSINVTQTITINDTTN